MFGTLYLINQGNSAYLAVTFKEHPAVSNNYVLDRDEDVAHIDLSNDASGIYSVALIVDGQFKDAKNLIKN